MYANESYLLQNVSEQQKPASNRIETNTEDKGE